MAKVAMFLEHKNWKDGWAGYIYAQEVKESLEYVKDSTDQFGKPVKVYRISEKFNLDTPGGVKSSDLVVKAE